jgi:hypothetical protein
LIFLKVIEKSKECDNRGKAFPVQNLEQFKNLMASTSPRKCFNDPTVLRGDISFQQLG